MTRFRQYLENYGRELNNKFERSRHTLTDSDVKGGRNERIIAEFLRQHTATSFIAGGIQIIDSNDRLSDEVDVVACNADQLFRDSDEGVLIAEGIDFCVQVKARVDSKEIARMFKNCASVKMIERRFVIGDETFKPVGVADVNISRIPYLTIAFTSALTAETLHEKLINESNKYSQVDQLDALFVIDSGLSFLNFREGGERVWKSGNKPIKSWLKMESGDQTLLEVLRFLHTQVPRVRRLHSPLVHYFPDSPGYEMRGIT